VNHGLSLYLTVTVLVTGEPRSAGSFKREVWLYDNVDKQKFIEKLEIVDWRTLLCQFEDEQQALFGHCKKATEAS
jgi:hypothetical protein